MEIKKYGEYILENFKPKSAILVKLIDNNGDIVDKHGTLIPNPYFTLRLGINRIDEFNNDKENLIVDDEWKDPTYDIVENGVTYSRTIPEIDKRKNLDEELLNQIIIDRDNQRDHEYIGGLDKNGFLFGLSFDDNGNLLNYEGEVVINSDDGNTWTDTNLPKYNNLISNTPTGWVNSKNDMENFKKVRRFSKNLSNNSGISGLRERLSYLQNVDTLNIDIRKKLSILTLLRHLKETKDYFTPSSAGFLLESYIAGLIDGGYTPEKNEKGGPDVIDSNGNTYQIKFYDYSSDLIGIGNLKEKILNTKKYKRSDFSSDLIVCLKKSNQIEIFMLKTTRTKIMRENHILNGFLHKPKEKKTPQTFISVSNLKKLRGSKYHFIIDLSSIDNRIKEVNSDVQNDINSIWNNISELQYNIETITTGVDKNHNNVENYEEFYINSESNLDDIRNKIETLKDNMGD